MIYHVTEDSGLKVILIFCEQLYFYDCMPNHIIQTRQNQTFVQWGIFTDISDANKTAKIDHY